MKIKNRFSLTQKEKYALKSDEKIEILFDMSFIAGDGMIFTSHIFLCYHKKHKKNMQFLHIRAQRQLILTHIYFSEEFFHDESV